MVVPQVSTDPANQGSSKGSQTKEPPSEPRLLRVGQSQVQPRCDEPARRPAWTSPTGAICAGYFADVLGFDEMPTMTIDRRRLILSCVHWDQFIFLIAEDDPMKCPRMDHYGFAVSSLDDLTGVRDRAVEFKKNDDRLELIDLHMDDQGP